MADVIYTVSLFITQFWWMFSWAFIFCNHIFPCLCLPGRCREVFSLQQFWMCRWGKTWSVGNFSSFPAAQLWLPQVCWELGVRSWATEEQYTKSTRSHDRVLDTVLSRSVFRSYSNTPVIFSIISLLCISVMIDINSDDERNPTGLCGPLLRISPDGKYHCPGGSGNKKRHLFLFEDFFSFKRNPFLLDSQWHQLTSEANSEVFEPKKKKN